MNRKTVFKSKKTIIISIASIAVVLLLSSLFLINMGIVSAQWNTQSNIEGFKINNATGALQETLYIYINDLSVFAEELRSILSEEIESQLTSTRAIKVFNVTNNTENTSFLGLHVTEQSTRYHPWSSECKYTIFYYFSNVGNTEYFTGFKNAETMYDNPPVIFNSSDGKQLLDIGQISVQGSFHGLFTKPKMEEMTIEQISDEIMKQVGK